MHDVSMNEIAVAATSSWPTEVPVLATAGISTCMAIILHGNIHNIPFVAMYHWAGFASHVNKRDEYQMLTETYKVFNDISDKIRTKFTAAQDEPISINGISIIGGEKQQKDEQGKIIVSGTAKEVKLLKQYALEICVEIFEVSDEAQPIFYNFKTQNAETIDVQVFPNYIVYQHHKGLFFEDTNRHPKNIIIEIPEYTNMAVEHKSQKP